MLTGFVVLGPLAHFNIGAQAQSTDKKKKGTLITDEMDVQIAPDTALHPGGVM